MILRGGSRCGHAWLFRARAGFRRCRFHRVECDFDAVAGLDLDFPALVLELLEGDHGFGFQAHVDDHHVVAYVYDEASEDHSGADSLVGDALFEELGKTFSHLVSTCAALLFEFRARQLTLAGNPVPSRMLQTTSRPCEAT